MSCVEPGGTLLRLPFAVKILTEPSGILLEPVQTCRPTENTVLIESRLHDLENDPAVPRLNRMVCIVQISDQALTLEHPF